MTRAPRCLMRKFRAVMSRFSDRGGFYVGTGRGPATAKLGNATKKVRVIMAVSQSLGKNTMASESIAFFDGRYMPTTEAKISIVDPAVTKSDIVFDVVSATGRVFFRLDDHVERFETSCRKIRIDLPVSRDEIRRISAECVHCSGFDDACVFMCGTRGPYRGGLFLGDPRDCDNGFYAYAVPYYYVVPRECVETGAHIWIAEARRAPNAAIDQRIKNFNRMDLTRGTFEALDHGADAAVLLSMEGYLAEGPGFNIWIVRDKGLLTPGDNLLEGITRRTVFDLAKEMGIEAKTAKSRAAGPGRGSGGLPLDHCRGHCSRNTRQ